MDYSSAFIKMRKEVYTAGHTAAVLKNHDPSHAPSVRAYELARAYAAGIHVIFAALITSHNLPQFLDTVDKRAPEMTKILEPVSPAYRSQAEEQIKTTLSVLISDLKSQI